MNENFLNSFKQGDDYLSNLNKNQHEAVNFIEGPVLVLSGAGTGKTKVLTSRIANLISKGICKPWNIMAVTFTNKAAKEMKERIFGIVGPPSEQVIMGTFHSIGSKILRKHFEIVGLKNNFSIFDMDDQYKVIKQLISDKSLDVNKFNPKLISNIFNKWKDKGYLSENINQETISTIPNLNMKDLFLDYQSYLLKMNAVDFGDLINYPIQIFKNNKEILNEWRQKISFVLVDEYQDTNIAQYLFIRLIVGENGNLCCVGDDDQSIYSWRGAQVKNILNFDKDFPNSKVIRLQQNYRSTKNILNAANKLISNNKSRLGKELWTSIEDGDDIKFAQLYDSNEEARFISDNIENLSREGVPYSEIAILVRTRPQSRIIEKRLNSIGLPNIVIGGPFYERLEIKDAIAYLRIIVNFNDDIAFQRIINNPRRGIGDTSIKKIMHLSKNLNFSFYDAVIEILQSESLSNLAKINLKKFIDSLTKWKSQLNLKSPSEFLLMVLEEAGYIDMWRNLDTDESQSRIDNLFELINDAADHDNINGFLENISLVVNSDRGSPSGVVSLMTMHAAKGLEFENVFLAGFEDGLFPSSRSLDENGEQALEEERRLAYVAITRAKSKLFISFANNRQIQGLWMSSIPSRFLGEIFEEFNFNQFNNTYKNFHNNLVNKISKKPNKNIFKTGNRVFHQKFGMGNIIEIENQNAKVKFDHAGIKNINSNFLNLKN